MHFENLISLLGLLLALASLTLDAIAFAIAEKKRKRPGKRPQSKR